MFFATAPSPLAAGFGTAFDHPLRRRVYAQAGRSAAEFLQKAVTASHNPAAQDASFTQDEKQFLLNLDVPGISKDQLRISIEGAVVRIESKEDAPRRYRAAYGFGQDIDSAASSAALENGVLTLTLAKVVPVSKVAELEIA
jgi:HSP20 family molecular chaperone IbpA